MTDDDRAMLAFERKWWQFAGNKEAEIATQFGMTPVRYYQRLNAVLDDPQAIAFDPQLVRRLRRIRTSREARRSA